MQNTGFSVNLAFTLVGQPGKTTTYSVNKTRKLSNQRFGRGLFSMGNALLTLGFHTRLVLEVFVNEQAQVLRLKGPKSMNLAK